MIRRGRKEPLRGIFPAPRAAVALVLLAAACAAAPPRPSPDFVIILPDDGGKTGAIVVKGTGGERLLTKPLEAVTVSPGAPPGEPFVMTEEEMRARVGSALEALPAPPRQFIFYFGKDSTELARESRALVNEAVRAFRERNAVDVSVVGHTDTMGDREYNSRLSLERARTVAALLTAAGIPSGLIEIASHGKDNPLVPTGDQVPEPRNRRVEVTVR